MSKPTFGSFVLCSGYIRKSGKHFEIDKKEIKASLVSKHDGETVTVEESPFNDEFSYREDKVVPIEEDTYVNRFDIVPCDFSGVYVGSVRLNTDIGCLLQQDDYQEYWDCVLDSPQIFAVVYYKNNSKRIVPLDMVQEEHE